MSHHLQVSCLWDGGRAADENDGLSTLRCNILKHETTEYFQPRHNNQPVRGNVMFPNQSLQPGEPQPTQVY